MGHTFLGPDSSSVASPTPSLWIVEAALEASLPAPNCCSKQRVRFDDHTYEFILEEHDNHNLWYSKPELDQIRAHNHQQVQARSCDMIRARKWGHHQTIYELDFDQDWTWRGLEYVLYKSPRTKLRLHHAKRVVEWQQRLDATDSAEAKSEGLAALARDHTAQHECEERARRIGQDDQAEARKIMGRWLPKGSASFDTTTTCDDDSDSQDETVSSTTSEESSGTGVDVHLVDSIIMSL